MSLDKLKVQASTLLHSLSGWHDERPSLIPTGAESGQVWILTGGQRQALSPVADLSP